MAECLVDKIGIFCRLPACRRSSKVQRKKLNWSNYKAGLQNCNSNFDLSWEAVASELFFQTCMLKTDVSTLRRWLITLEFLSIGSPIESVYGMDLFIAIHRLSPYRTHSGP